MSGDITWLSNQRGASSREPTKTEPLIRITKQSNPSQQSGSTTAITFTKRGMKHLHLLSGDRVRIGHSKANSEIYLKRAADGGYKLSAMVPVGQDRAACLGVPFKSVVKVPHIEWLDNAEIFESDITVSDDGVIAIATPMQSIKETDSDYWVMENATA